MAEMRTEALHRSAGGLDIQPPHAVLSALADAQVEAASAVRQAIPQIAVAARLIADRLGSGGRLVYAAAGSSGLMALADGLELPGTFGIARDRIAILIAGGDEALHNLAGGPEDDATDAAKAIGDCGVGSADCVIAISASGSTPYAVRALEEAKSSGAATIAIANNKGAPLFEKADVAVLIETPPEVIAGSTRMGAGTAQKIALNMMSTLAAIHLGHVHDGYMVSLTADNKKLRDRASRIVSAITGRDGDEAQALLERGGGEVKTAVLLAAGAGSAEAARKLLDGTGQKLRPALSAIEGSRGQATSDLVKNRT
ncbi:N-acetylmuramic acid 6-phosphate etherase [Mesorhizobium sp. Root157]|uniref:N-acetylmuramic acid 6-phosphate etherase n=1 Tax=Mesorhizobium sp. Root157 TaxID=1736477 RepID=UPI0006FB67CC|nr:N-acetylmuramic acid 6-phosphate etherase [Mesorhizobium sp. Root157]KQZ82940.1 N-acetylmuramic acid 6-phosphate etherase [Mesorhizobium sp. Root157]